MQKYSYQDQTFLLDDTKGCYIEVGFKDAKTFVGVNLQGTPEHPYTWGPNDYVTPDGLSLNYGGGFRTVEEALNNACNNILNSWRESQARREFKPEEACEALHNFVKNLPSE